jgi:hypothetical protein
VLYALGFIKKVSEPPHHRAKALGYLYEGRLRGLAQGILLRTLSGISAKLYEQSNFREA